MTRDDLHRIETELEVVLPELYKKTMREYPFAAEPFAKDCELPDDPDRLIGTNRNLRAQGFFGLEWPAQFFSFGGDGSGNEYYLDLSSTESPVFLADHEASAFEEIAPGFAEWLDERRVEYAQWAEEDRRREERRRNKKWWQFWL